MIEKTLSMIFLNEEGAKSSITLSGIRDDLTQAEVSAAMDVIIAKNIFQSNGGNLVAKYSAQITDKTVTALAVK